MAEVRKESTCNAVFKGLSLICSSRLASSAEASRKRGGSSDESRTSSGHRSVASVLGALQRRGIQQEAEAELCAEAELLAEVNGDGVVPRTVLQRDAVQWLEELGPRGLPSSCCVITSLPDWSEVKKGKDLTLRGYVKWFQHAARLVFSCCPEGALTVFLQTDITSGGQWLDKAALLCEVADACGATLLWHKITFDPSSVGAPRQGQSADYSHLLCFMASSGNTVDRRRHDVGADDGRAVLGTKCSIPDLIPRGRKVYAQGMGCDAIEAVLAWISKVVPKVQIVVDPFCGRGTVLALANQIGQLLLFLLLLVVLVLVLVLLLLLSLSCQEQVILAVS
ncbi:unnamed protein product [Polarella glacialis]|uniref:DNA methylase N-4/N-6 domain-containing protein n=1 Tax=Polarella glacialis TaxID=89957 RepID=A0A813EQG6_POLGL|nr:unnamed protein product [Polarella glacialis]CAE8729653.1 unnamed protein product [Polarella glacialis]